ncbi:hypothetical protein GGR22_000705 [Flavobacterium gossypii]|uniref:Uncharacterized protein n=1 Tax=Flavobacterium gossypii TaxID=1646119 RepID=A0ABR6DLL8_9FLAO|nr:hypothetical protein [Flavobacterium gossypii]MBA9072579.1 hypothetical protein [Flavobacterium gossypii]
MNEKELEQFFEEYPYLGYFYRTKKLYELTNNLDIFLLKTLKRDFTAYYLQKGLNLAKDHINGNLPQESGTEYYNAYLFMKDYFRNKSDKTEIDILNETLDGLISDNEYKLVEFIFEGIADFIFDIDELIRYSEKKMSSPVVDNDEKEVEENELIDLSEGTITSKIIFLEKLGVIEFLRTKSPFNTSINSLANAISGLTGAKPTSIQPMLNAMLSKETSDKNNPLKSTNTVKVVTNKLINIGYSPK